MMLQKVDPKIYQHKVATPKRYYSNVPGARFIFEDGHEAFFRYGFYDTASEQEIYELNAIMGNNPTFYDKETMAVEAAPAVPQNAASEAEIASQDAVLARTGNMTRITQEMGLPVGQINVEQIFGESAGTPQNPALVDAALQQAAAEVRANPTIAPPPAVIVAPPVVAGHVTPNPQLPSTVGPGATVGSDQAMDALRARVAASAASTGSK